MLAVLYLWLAILIGERLSGYFFPFISTVHRWATGTLVGLLISACFSYLTGRFFSSPTDSLLFGDVLFFVSATLFLIKFPPQRRAAMIETPGSRSAVPDWIAVGIFCAIAYWMMFTTFGFNGDKIGICISKWNDYGPNIGIVQDSIGHKARTHSNEPVQYQFLFYYIAGNLELLGLHLTESVNLLSVLTLVCMLALVMVAGELLFESRAVGMIAAAFFFFHGTLNFIPFLASQTSFAGVVDAIYHLKEYLPSGYPYQGEDWGVWTQVIYVNQRHFASSIGILLIVLIFLLTQYPQGEPVLFRKSLDKVAACRGQSHLFTLGLTFQATH